jgi:hypothetical protein
LRVATSFRCAIGAMEIQLLQAVGKIAGIGGLALGAFVLLFEEVIRKNIFPTLSDDHASGLIRQFMYLTFGVAVCGIAAWTYVAAKTPSTLGGAAGIGTAAHTGDAAAAAPGAKVDVTGTWSAPVKYSWGDTHAETFQFEVHGQELSGTASYVTAPHGIVGGKIDGSRLSFQTTSYSELNDKRYQETHRYRGTVSADGDAIEFVLDTDSGYDAPPPAKFTAHRSAAK